MNTRFDAQGRELVAAEDVLLLLTHLRKFDDATVEELICAWNLDWRYVDGERYFVLEAALDFVDVVLGVYPRQQRRSA